VPKILVADDNANIQKMVALSFEERGIQVVAVGNGEAAVRRIPDVQPDLVLADIFMPVRNGYEVCEFVKKDERFSHVPVILLVGAFDPLDEKEARRVGADGVLKKPFVPPDPLIAMVMSALEKNPKIAAELAKAKEAKEAPAPVVLESVPEPPTSVRAEPKPLPDFPEPANDEEAAIAYGFSSPRRTIDDEPIEAAEAKAPVAQPGGARDEEEFDGSSTSHDWRRNAMDFDVPAEAANRAAFMHDEDSDAAMFPSERDVPPRHVRVPDPAEDSDPVIQDRAPAKVEAEASAPAPVRNSESDFFAPPDSPATATAEPLQEVEPVVESETVHEPASQASPSHWMDQLAQGSSDRPATDWMSALSEQSAQASIVARPEPQAEPVAPRETPAEDFGAQASSYSSTETEGSHDSAPVREESSGASFFADEPAPSTSSSSWLSPAPSAPEPFGETVEATSSEPVPFAASKSDQGFERDAEDSAPLAFKDPDLVEPPAVHVTPEPLLVEDEPEAPSQYGARGQDVQPLHSFLVSPSTPLTEESSASASSSNRAEIAVAPLEPEPSITSERIPTGPPPSREALAEIPFLTPPPEFRSQAPEPPAPNSGTVDAVVRKVLEKLEPQLHDLLSQGVLKPLVENLLQSELAKKEK